MSAVDPEPTQNLVELHQVTKHYQMGDEVVRALDGVDLEIKDGELVAIMGASGSGKSTMMNVLGGLDTPTSGEYHLSGTQVGALSREELAEVRNKHIGFVFQSFHLLPRQTALANVTLPLIYRQEGRPSSKARVEMAKNALSLVGLGDRLDHRPNEMSGGQRQRVAIARALVSEPSIILADEPTGNLDSTTGEEILNLLVNLNKEHGRTVIVVTHEDEVGMRCDRVIWMKDGKIVRDTPSEEAFSSAS